VLRRLVIGRADAASLAAFRILFGGLMAAGAVRFMALGWVGEFYILPTFHFTWDLFPWVRPLPGWLMYAHFAALAILGVAIALGFHYRLCMALFFAGFTYVELIDKTTYLNHYYLVSLLSGLMIVLPAHREWSLDATRLSLERTVPAWTIALLRFQIAIVFLFAGLAKLNADWLFEAQPLRIWLTARSDLPLAGPLLAHSWVAYAFSWFGAAYDLTIVGFLLWNRTRRYAFVTVIVFHIMTGLLFPIGMFPWIMIVATLMFFPPDWPRRWPARSANAVAVVDSRPVDAWPVTTAVLLAVYATIQIALPLRGYWPGTDPDWTYRGFNFAWRVMLVEKAGSTELVAFDRHTGRSWPVRIREYVTERQEQMMAQDPSMVRTLARHVAADLRSRGLVNVGVRADSVAAINGRPAQRLIDPEIDLSASALPDRSDWIVPRQGSASHATEHAPP
jgi:hypothetical protein